MEALKDSENGGRSIQTVMLLVKNTKSTSTMAKNTSFLETQLSHQKMENLSLMKVSKD